MAADLSAVVTAAPNGATLRIRVIPRAGRSAIAGIRQGALLLRVAAAPVDGAANDAVRDLLAATFGVPRRAIAIVRGERSRDKTVRIAGVDIDHARRLLLDLAPPLT